MKATTKTAHKVAAAIASEVADVLASQVIAEETRQRVDAIAAAVLAANAAAFPVATVDDVCELSDAQVDAFFQLVEAANREAGYEFPAGYCPALIAEDAQHQAENRLVEVAAPIFKLKPETVTRNAIHRRKFVSLAVGLVTAADRETN